MGPTVTTIRPPACRADADAVRAWTAGEIRSRAEIYRRTTHDETHVSEDQVTRAVDISDALVAVLIAAGIDPADIRHLHLAAVVDVVLSSDLRQRFTAEQHQRTAA